MCTGGRILHHLRQNLPNPSTHVLFVGHQGEGSLGRQLVDGAKTVKIFGDTVPVRAQIHELFGFNGHAGQSDLLRWFAPLDRCAPRLVITHGESPQRSALAGKVEARHGIKAILPEIGDIVEL